jgi:hypothetical protein
MTEPPTHLMIRPEPPVDDTPQVDLLSHVLAQIRLTGEQVYSSRLARHARLDLDAAAAHVCVVTDGALHIEADEHETMVIDTGDLVMLPRGAGDLRLAAMDGPATLVLCRFRFEPDSLPGMLSTLPRCVHIRRAESAG